MGIVAFIHALIDVYVCILYIYTHTCAYMCMYICLYMCMRTPAETVKSHQGEEEEEAVDFEDDAVEACWEAYVPRTSKHRSTEFCLLTVRL